MRLAPARRTGTSDHAGWPVWASICRTSGASRPRRRWRMPIPTTRATARKPTVLAHSTSSIEDPPAGGASWAASSRTDMGALPLADGLAGDQLLDPDRRVAVGPPAEPGFPPHGDDGAVTLGGPDDGRGHPLGAATALEATGGAVLVVGIDPDEAG